ncbi:MAG TPA: portal protein [Phycisphaerales bacterium]|nr:portal protein [Phycisphaerales bacterium]
MNILELYDELVPKREPFLQEADRIARLTLPHLDVLGSGKRRSYETDDADLRATARPYSDAGAQAVSQFAAALKALLLPPNAMWFKLAVPVEFETQLQQVGPEAVAAMDGMLAMAEDKPRSKMAEHGVYGECEEGFRRLLIEGQQVCHVTSEGFRMLPLRCFCVKRKNGKVVRIVIKEETYEDGEEAALYTLVDYAKGGVWQQTDKQKTARRVNASPKQYFVVTSMKPTAGCDYATSFASLYQGTLYTINFLSKKIQEITHWAAVNVLGIDPSLQITPQEFQEKLQRGDNVFSFPPLPDGRMAGISFFSAQAG